MSRKIIGKMFFWLYAILTYVIFYILISNYAQ